MCFTTQQSLKAQALENRYQAKLEHPDAYNPGIYRAFAFPKTPVICNTNPENIEMVQWGLIPHWAKDPSIQRYTLNARHETLHEKPSFKYYIKQPCIILVDAFYEWQWLDPKGSKKQAYRLSLKQETGFSIAGLWSTWVNPQTGQQQKTYTLITQEAQGQMREIHNRAMRMPLMLNSRRERLWLEQKAVVNAFEHIQAEPVSMGN